MSLARNEDFRDSFFEECEELMEAMQDGFDRLAGDMSDSETMHAIFRAVHSIKGGAGAFRLDSLVGFAHHFETALDKVRAGRVTLDDDLLEIFRQCGDHLSDLVEAAREGNGTAVPGSDVLLDRLDETIGTGPSAEETKLPDFEPVMLDLGFADIGDATSENDFTEGTTGFVIAFRADAGLFASGNEPALLFRALERFGPVTVRADLDGVPLLGELAPENCTIGWELTVETGASKGDVRDVFDFVEGLCTLDITPLCSPPRGASPDSGGGAGDPPALDELLALDAIPSLDELADGAASGPARVPASTRPRSAGAETEQQNRPGERKPSGTIRVDLERVDKLINLVGELVIKEAMLSQSISDFHLPSESEVSVGLDNLKQLAGEIQEGVMAIRAQPVKPVFQRMSRIAREASAATGKPVRFLTDGEYTEVDKTMIERLVDPLTHMIRNAVDHGLETPERRAAAGKPAEGTVMLAAAHRSGRVVIDVSDDGGGINRDRVRQIAVERGLISDSAELSPSEIDNLLFLPGFSSKEEVSELSGRGVGLDVVRSEISGLGGRVSIQSQPGEGTTFSISLPLTLAVLEGMVIKVADQTMVVPISAIQETLQPRAADIDVIGQQTRLLRNRNGLVPIIDLGLFFGFRPAPVELDHHVLLLIESAPHQRLALIVDEIQDQRQVVIKSLETNYRQVGGVAAATILGDGRIALIIDPDNIVTESGSAGPVELATSKAD